MYTGRRFDNESGLYYYRARYYWPTIGRFLQTDPIGYADGINWYTYVGNNPLVFIDPFGLCGEGIGEGVDDQWVYDPTVQAQSRSVPVPGKKGWKVRHDRPEGKDPAHDQYEKRGKKYSRRVYENGTQKKHGKGVDKDIPWDVIEAGKNALNAVAEGAAATGEWISENPGQTVVIGVGVILIIIPDPGTTTAGAALIGLGK
jgi:RHS repeat-associated protein